MKGSKNDIIKCVLAIAESIGKKENYESYISITRQSLPELVKNISYDMFLSEFDIEDTRHAPVYFYYVFMLEYAKELDRQGYVEFEDKQV